MFRLSVLKWRICKMHVLEGKCSVFPCWSDGSVRCIIMCTEGKCDLAFFLARKKGRVYKIHIHTCDNWCLTAGGHTDGNRPVQAEQSSEKAAGKPRCRSWSKNICFCLSPSCAPIHRGHSDQYILICDVYVGGRGGGGARARVCVCVVSVSASLRQAARPSRSVLYTTVGVFRVTIGTWQSQHELGSDEFKFNVALRPQRPGGQLGTESPGRPSRLSHSSRAPSTDDGWSVAVRPQKSQAY